MTSPWPAWFRQVRTIPILLFSSLLLGGLSVRPASAGPGLTFDERVDAQRRIEDAYWRHRIWPEQNPTPKPPLSAVMPEEAFRRRVKDYLRKSNALELFWRRPVTGEQLQAEVDRMSRDTRDGGMLRELYAALGDDARLIAETLARQNLVDRLIVDWYSQDDRFHGGVERRAREALRRARSAAELSLLGSEHSETTFRSRQDGDGDPAGVDQPELVELNQDEWADLLHRVAGWFGEETIDSIAIGLPSGLLEEPDRFFAVALVSRSKDELTLATVAWTKRSFDVWWTEEAPALDLEVRIDEGPYALAAPAEGGCVDDTWLPPPFYVPAPRVDHTAVWTGTEMIVWGGRSFETGPLLNTGGRYSPSTDTWTPTSVGANVPAPRWSHTAVWTGTEMIVWGGLGLTNSGGRYDPSTDTWTTTSVGQNVPSGRWLHSAVWTGTEMIVWGHANDKTGGRYDPSTDTWATTSVAAGVPAARFYHSAVWTGTEMIVWGGSSGGKQVNSGGRYDPSSDSWTATPKGANVPVEREQHTAVWTGTEMVVWGGFGGPTAPLPPPFPQPPPPKLLNTGGRYNPSAGTWTATSLGPSQRMGHRAIWTGTEMIIYGGSSSGTGGRYRPSTDTWIATAVDPKVVSDGTTVWTGTEMIVWGGVGPSNAGARYDPSTDSWVPTKGSNPGSRQDHTAVWTGTEMVVWGGFKNASTGWRYAPSTSTWSPTSTLGAPSGRYFHTAVWTGSKMIVWGGADDSAFNTGGRYDPTTNAWTPTSVGANVPLPRTYHTAVWTGTEMIVWGGQNYPDPAQLQTGGRYDPATDSWLPTSAGSAVPSARQFHRAVWTGTEMIVWGGETVQGSQQTFVNTGGRYAPSTDTWTATSTVGVPNARQTHTAVWTGTEMIVWGGREKNPSFITVNTGGRYAPSTDSWLPTSVAAEVPSARVAHRAVWTGMEMIVWGGSSDSLGNNALNTGGRYSPSADAWRATSVANVPTPRLNHTAVWTGAEMIVWGGKWNSFASPNDTGRYCAACVELSTFQRDVDEDGFGDPEDSVQACVRPDGYVANDRDCDDTHVSVHPGAPEICDGLANDCDAEGWPTSADLDEDTVDNVCDNCPLVSNVVQTDSDREGVGDACDCAASDPTLWAAPLEVQGIALAFAPEAAGSVTVSWASQDATSGSATDYDVARIDLEVLRSVGYSAVAVCADGGAANTPYLEEALACAGTGGGGCGYLVRARNDCGVGSYGTGTLGHTLDPGPCP